MARRSLVLLVSLLLLAAIPGAAAQSLPASLWYSVIYQPQTDQLVWVNADGQQASLPRPRIDGEGEFLDVRISPNGRTMVMVSRLVDGREAIGVYDMASSAFVATHNAQPGEHVVAGGSNIFTANSQYFAVGFFAGDFTTPTWRVILFDAATGDRVAFIDNTHPEAPEANLFAPTVQYLSGTSVHFQLVLQAVGASAVHLAYAWNAFGADPTAPTLAKSDYVRSNIDILPLTGEVVTTYKDEAYPSAPMDGQTPDFNAVGRGIPRPDSAYTPVHVDSTRFHLAARWASGGDWILFYSTDAMNNSYWNVVRADGRPGNNTHVPLEPRIRQALGTSDGYLTLDDTRLLSFGSDPLSALSQPLMQLNAGDRIVYVTPIGVTFMATPWGGPTAQPVTPTPETPVFIPTPTNTPVAPPPAPVDCSLVLPPRVGIGSHARVVPSTGNLNLRQQPNGAILLVMSGGDEFDIIGGFVCVDGLHWWQINRGGAIGWVAESTSGGYFIEPYIAPPAPEIITDTPPPPVEAGCELALPSRLSAGTNVTILRDQVRPYVSANGEIIPQRFFMEGTSVSVTAGPTCAGGSRWWLVLGQANVARFGQQQAATQGWVREDQDGTYNLSPQ